MGSTMPTPRLRNDNGPAILSYGFRPFFFFGSLYSGLTMIVWLPLFYGELELSTLLVPVDWHIHELLFGYLPAVITGFLFTAVPNWTGRMPIQGTPLLFLVLLWLAGRLAVSFSAYIGWLPAMLIDLAFLTAICLVIGNEIVAGRNWRNLKVLAPLAVLLAANTLFHLEAHFDGLSHVSRRLAMAAVLTLIMLIGGRIIPSFTRNWLARENPGRLPVPFARFDLISMAVAVAALALWVIMPGGLITGSLMAIASAIQLFRLLRWAGDRTLREPLVTVLHVSYLFIPAGFALLASAVFWPETIPQVAGIHALGVGAVGGMTLSVMVRATFGHSGQPITAGLVVNILFLSLFAAALARVLAAIGIGQQDLLLHISAFGWLLAFAGFSLAFAPLFFRARRK
jgi:uncharacterized protein involved in response to NO